MRQAGSKLITVFLADDHTVIRDALRYLLDAQHDIKVVGDAANGRKAVRLVQELKPDVVVMDITMPELNGLLATQQIHENNPSVRVIILSIHSSTEYVYRALQAGASGYLAKESSGAEVVEAVRAVDSGQRYLNHEVAEALDEYILQSRSESIGTPLNILSRREREVLQLVVEGHSSAAIAKRLSLSPKTIDTYRSRLMQKLGIKDVPGLTKFAIKHGIIKII